MSGMIPTTSVQVRRSPENLYGNQPEAVLMVVEHVRLQPRCGACAFPFAGGPRVLALSVSQMELKRRFSIIDAFNYPTTTRPQFSGGKLLCWLFSCGKCEGQSETTTIHLDCWKLYAANTPASRRLSGLYSAAVARSPWRGSPSAIMLAQNYDVPLVMDMAAKIFEQLTSLPPEIQGMIAANLGESPLWRYSAVLALAKAMETTPKAAKSATMTPVSFLHTWQRGEVPLLSEVPLESPALVTIDSMGIRKISRSVTPTAIHRIGHDVFVVDLSDTQLDFNDGQCRISAPDSEEVPLVWNTPNPPSLDECAKLPSPLRRTAAAVNLRSCFGFTFFISSGTVHRIHAHTQLTPTADTTWQHLALGCRSTSAWVYVPLPPTDELKAFGVRGEVIDYQRVHSSMQVQSWTTYCFRTSLLGDFTIGPWRNGTSTTVAYHTSRDSTLVHTTLDRGLYSTPAAFSHIHPKDTQCEDFSPVLPQSPSSAIRSPCYASALLASVRSVWIYRNSEGLCIGLIIDYKNGGQRALGSCRVGVDPAEMCTKLEDVRFCSVLTALGGGVEFHGGVKVEICSASDDEEQESGWTRFKEGGMLEMWFDHKTVVLTLV